MIPTPRRFLSAVFALSLGIVAVACGSSDGDGASTTPAPKPVTIRLLTHDSFALSDDVLAAFTKDTDIEVELIQGGDAGTVVNQAILTNGNPQADVLFGIDSTFLSRALAEDLFVPYKARELAEVDEGFLLDPKHRVTPIDYGDVCLNYDKAYFEDAGIPVPKTLQDLTKAIYKGLLVVENPATSSPGLAFLLATIDRYGEDGWQQYWSELRLNLVHISDGWEDAYYTQFSGGLSSEGSRPIVVSYASSPSAELVYADPPVTEAPTGVITDGCYRQVEAAGILAGTEHEVEARSLIDFLLSTTVQADLPLSMFVYPVRRGVALPKVFVDNSVLVDDPTALRPDVVGARREEWINTWTDLVVR